MNTNDLYNGRWVIRKPYKKNGSPFFYARIVDRRHNREHRFSTRKNVEKEARLSAIEWCREHEQREHGFFPVSFGDAYRKFLQEKEHRNLRESTIKDYRVTCESVYEPSFGSALVCDLRTSDIESLIFSRRVGARTQRKYLCELSAFFRWASHRGWCTADPTKTISISIPANRRQCRILSVDEVRRLLAAAQDSLSLATRQNRESESLWHRRHGRLRSLHLSVLIAVSTGLGRSEIRRLTWGHVHFDSDPRIEIDATIATNRKTYAVPLTTHLHETLRRERDNARSPVASVVGTCGASLQGACRRAGLVGQIGWNDLRRAFREWIARTNPQSVLDHLSNRRHGSVHPVVTWADLRLAIDRLPSFNAIEELRS